MFNPTISAILRGAWLIDPAYAAAHLPMVLGILQGNLSGAEFFTGSAEMERPFAVSGGKRVDAFFLDRRTNRWTFDDKSLESGFVGVVPLIGPVMKYNGSCGEPGMTTRQGWISEMMASPKFGGLMSYIDSPGGQADGTPQYADFIKSLDIPKIALVNGGAYSAGAWTASAHDKIYMANEYSGFGSIGAYRTIVDFTGYFEKQGYKVQDIYPDESEDKNKSYREAIKGNTKLIKEETAELARFFISAFAENRSGKLTSEEWNTGKVFKGKKSLEIGLIDGIQSFDDTIREIQGKRPSVKPSPKTSNSTQSKNTNTKSMEFENLSALSEVESPSEEQIELANGELKTNKINSVILVEKSFLDEAANVTTERNTLKDANATLTSDLAAANSAKDALATENATLKEKIAKRPGADLGGKVDNKESNSEKTEVQALDEELANLPHNASVMNNPLFS